MIIFYFIFWSTGQLDFQRPGCGRPGGCHQTRHHQLRPAQGHRYVYLQVSMYIRPTYRIYDVTITYFHHPTSFNHLFLNQTSFHLLFFCVFFYVYIHLTTFS